MKLSKFLTLLGFIAGSTLQLTAGPLRVFILAGQSNMQGQGVVDLVSADYNNGKGTLIALYNDPKQKDVYKHLKTKDDKWAVRDDVWVRYQRGDSDLKAGNLGLGYSAYDDLHHFGVELQFGHVVGEAVKDQVLIIKTAWGGKNLDVDFRPPSAGGQVGPFYTQMLAEVQAALKNLKTDFPSYNGRGYQLEGFVWWQGWNDFCEPKMVKVYEKNLVHLINDIRKDLKQPNLPVVVADLTGSWTKTNPNIPQAALDLKSAQKAATERKEFKGTVKLVETIDFVREAKESPHPGHEHHEGGNAETYFLVGDAMGKAMLEMVKK